MDKAHHARRPGEPVKRRALLQVLALGLSSGCLGALPGPTGPRNPPEAPAGQSRTPKRVLSIETWDSGETDEGTLRVFGTIRNTGDASASATVASTVAVDEKKQTKTTDVSVSAGETAEFELVFDVSYEAFTGNGSINLHLE